MDPVSRGLSNKQIALRCELSPVNVGRQVRQIRAKLGAKTNVHAVVIAIKSGVIWPQGQALAFTAILAKRSCSPHNISGLTPDSPSQPRPLNAAAYFYSDSSLCGRCMRCRDCAACAGPVSKGRHLSLAAGQPMPRFYVSPRRCTERIRSRAAFKSFAA